MIKLHKNTGFLLALVLTAGAFTSPTRAEPPQQAIDIPATENEQDALSGLPEDTTHPILRLTPDKSELIRLEEESASIIIGNPLHINVIADSSKLLVIIPRSPGATHFTVLGKKGQVIMQRHVIVASPAKDYVRVKRTCAGNEDCQPTSVFYCPDMCHPIGIEDQGSSKTDNADGGGGSSSDSSKSSDDKAPQQPQNSETPNLDEATE